VGTAIDLEAKKWVARTSGLHCPITGKSSGRHIAAVAGVIGQVTNMRWLIFLALPFLVSCENSIGEESEVVDTVRNRLIQFKVTAPDEKGLLPLVLISHGSGGHYSDHDWLVNALVKSGYIVAAPNHPFNTRRNSTPEGFLRIWDRPGDISFLLTTLLTDPQWAERIDESRLGVAGFSGGGHTVIALAGGIFDPDLMRDYCAGPTRGPDCDLIEDVEVDLTNARDSYKDSRIRAFLAMAPAVGPGMSAAGLAGIAMPTQIIAAEDDEILYPALHAAHYAQHIPNAKFTLLPKGGHFVFLQSCNLPAKIADWFLDQFNLCGQGIDVDRRAVQKDVAELAVDFFNEHLTHDKMYERVSALPTARNIDRKSVV
jgi:predicted dienelactone hydrolase